MGRPVVLVGNTPASRRTKSGFYPMERGLVPPGHGGFRISIGQMAALSQRFRQGDKISGKTDLHRPGPFGAGLPEKSLHPPRKTGRGRETNVPKGLGRHPV